MKFFIFFLVSLVSLFVCRIPEVSAYENTCRSALAWLESQQNDDGSWGSVQPVKTLYTSAVVNSLRSFYRQDTSYYSGIAWLENHDAMNLDYQGRKISSLLPHGDTVQTMAEEIIQASRQASGDAKGWGLTVFYNASPLDTALVLSALRDTSTWSSYASPLSSLQSSQNADGGWGVDAQSDPLTTAVVIQSLCRYQALVPSVESAIVSAQTYLAGQVATGDSALLRAETALALLPNFRHTAYVVVLLDSLQSDQDSQGGWAEDEYITARVVHAMAVALGKDPDAMQTLSDVCDAGMRTVLNQILGKNTADALSLGEMQEITSISAEGAGIDDLCGVADLANLTYADLRNNNITSLQALAGLSNLTTVLLDGNPLSDTEDADQDGFSDLAELQRGSNPLDPESVPTSVPVPATNRVGLLLAMAVLAFIGLYQRIRTDKKGRIMKHNIFFILLFSLISGHAFPAMGGQDLTSQEIKNIQKVSQAVLLSRSNAQKKVNREIKENSQTLLAAQRIIQNLEKQIFDSITSPSINNTSAAFAGIQSGSIQKVEQEPYEIHLNSDTMGFEKISDNSAAGTSSADITQTAQPATGLESETDAATQARNIKIDEALDQAITGLNSLLPQTTSMAESAVAAEAEPGQCSMTTGFAGSPPEKQVLNKVIRQVAGELQAMQEEAPDLKKIRKLGNRIGLWAEHSSPKPPSPTFITRTKHLK